MARKGATVQEQAERDLRLTRVAPLMLSGKTQQEIADELAVDQSTISRDIRTLRQRWKRSALRDTDRRIGEQDATYQQLIVAHLPLALAGKTRSAEVVINALEKQSKLLGLDQPTKQKIDFDGSVRIELVGVDVDKL